MKSPGPGLVPIRAVCEQFGIHPDTGHKWRREGTFPIEVIEAAGRYYCRA